MTLISIQKRVPDVLEKGALNAEKTQRAFKDIWDELHKFQNILALQHGGSFSKDFAAKPGCVYLVNPSGGQVNVDLPNTTDSYLDRILIINDSASTNVIKLRAYPGTTLDGNSTYDMTTAWGTIELISTGVSARWCLR